ncbi:hypothetical protein ZIOFF_035056 [Zingiber officinale]|uniref:SKP1 component POZ domain-containing protein n=1 Tax=Zingiber officinale TaxID=94328 RepID=A0A8J5GJN3_ZINOF|nr:hypothetical protein ZIOFF_035056 [Zingiber officinale]
MAMTRSSFHASAVSLAMHAHSSSLVTIFVHANNPQTPSPQALFAALNVEDKLRSCGLKFRKMELKVEALDATNCLCRRVVVFEVGSVGELRVIWWDFETYGYCTQLDLLSKLQHEFVSPPAYIKQLGQAFCIYLRLKFLRRFVLAPVARVSVSFSNDDRFLLRFERFPMDTDKKIILLSSEGELFEVDAAVAMASQTIKYMVEGNCGYGGIPIPNVTSMILAKVIEYCKKHANVDAIEPTIEELLVWDNEFVKVEVATLFNLVLVRFDTSLIPSLFQIYSIPN